MEEAGEPDGRDKREHPSVILAIFKVCPEARDAVCHLQTEEVVLSLGSGPFITVNRNTLEQMLSVVDKGP